MIEIRCPTLGETWLSLLREVYRAGETVGNETRELLDVWVAFRQADLGTDPLLGRFASAEHIEHMRKVFFSTEANRFGHSYADKLRGPTGRKDLCDVIELLAGDPPSKRAVATWVGDGDGKVPCITAVQFLRRDGTLRANYFSRGQDIYRKFYADALCIHEMGRRVAEGLKIPLSLVSGAVSSAHVYLDDLAEIRGLLACWEAMPGPQTETRGRSGMKVFLVVPRCLSPKQTYREYPLGVGMIATALRRAGHDVAVYDQNVEGPEDGPLMARLRAFGPRIVGFSVVTPAYPAAKRQIGRVRRECPETLVLAGGVHAWLFPEDFLADGADAVVLGDGSRPLVALAERLSEDRPWGDLLNFVCRDPQGQLVRNRVAKRLSDEDPGIVDRDVYNLPLYTHHSMMASLGCPYRCAFCCNYSGTMLQEGMGLRRHDDILDEMRYLADRHHARQVFFADDVFLFTPQSVLEFCARLAAADLDVEWVAQMRADLMDADVAQAMAVARCRRVYFGVESGSEAVLRRVRKKIGKEAIRRGVLAAKQAGLRVKTGWIFGLPGTLAEQRQSIAFMRELRPHEISIHQLVPFPGTEYYARPADFGLRFRDPKDFASFCYGGLGDNVSFDYLSRGQLIELLEQAAKTLEAEGYVSSDRATPQDEYVYTTPLSGLSISVFSAPSPDQE